MTSSMIFGGQDCKVTLKGSNEVVNEVCGSWRS